MSTAHWQSLQKVLTADNLKRINAAELMTIFGHINGMLLLRESAVVARSAKANRDHLFAICTILPYDHARTRLFRMLQQNSFEYDNELDFPTNTFFGPTHEDIPHLKPLEPLQMSLIASNIDFSIMRGKQKLPFYLGNLAAGTVGAIDYDEALLQRLGRRPNIPAAEDTLFWRNADQFLKGATLTQKSPIPVIRKLLVSLHSASDGQTGRCQLADRVDEIYAQKVHGYPPLGHKSVPL